MFSKKIKSWITFSIIPVSLLIAGFFIYKDYGISWDDPIQHKLGTDTFDYITKKNTQLLKNADRLYGSFFELLLIFGEKSVGAIDSQAVYFSRHFFVFLSFTVGVIFFQLLCLDYFEKKYLAHLATLALIISPRIFAHSFYNSKDIPNMAFFIITIYFASRFIKKQNIKNTIALAITTGMLISIRLTGIFVPVLTIALTLPFRSEDATGTTKKLAHLGTYLILIPLFTIIFWPILWENPLNNFRSAVKTMSTFPFAVSTRYFGKNYKGKLPWHYLFGWIFVSTQISYSLGFLAGIYHVIKDFVKTRAEVFANKKRLLILGWFFLPVISIIVTKTPLYDGWRHMFFVYPALLIICVEGIYLTVRSLKIKVVKTAILTLILLDILGSAVFMVKQHPFQQLYFNPAVKNPGENFYLDYWGLSYKQGLEWILKNNSNEKIKVYAASVPAKYNLMILDPEERKRLEVSEDIENFDYFITNYRGHRKMQEKYPLLYEIKVKNLPILGIYNANLRR